MEDDIETLRAALARAEQERDEAIEDRRVARDDSARAAAMVVVLRAEVERLKAAMPSDNEIASVLLALRCCDANDNCAGMLLVPDRLADIRGWLSRLPAPVATNGGE